MQRAFLTGAVFLMLICHASASETFVSLKAPSDGVRFVLIKPGEHARSVAVERRGQFQSTAGGGASDNQSYSSSERPSGGLTVTRQRIDFSAGREDRINAFGRPD